MANIQLADNLRRLRKQYNYTQAQIGKKLHITHQAYSNYETGVREPNLQLLAELSWIYHTSVDSLITQYCNAKNPSSVEVKNYFCIKIENSENDILLTKNEVNFLLTLISISKRTEPIDINYLGSVLFYLYFLLR